jgi:hypothetical protein
MLPTVTTSRLVDLIAVEGAQIEYLRLVLAKELLSAGKFV